jgi:large subunit ribosomal protein L19e
MKKLDKRKELAAKVLKVGKKRIVFDSSKLTEIKEAITKQDIRDFYKEGIITIKDIKGRKTKKKRKTKRGPGKIKKKIKTRKQDYVKLVRKLRKYIGELKKQEKINDAQYKDIRKKIKAKTFKDKAHLKEYVEGLK